MDRYPYALQLYSVRDYCEKDPEAGLRQVKEAGYDHVETAGFYGIDAGPFKTMLDRIGLTPVSMHVGYEQIVGDLDEVIRQAQLLGVAYAVVPWLGEEVCPDKAHWLMAAEQMDEAGAVLRKADIQLCYHNHAHEFQRMDGETLFDLIFGNSDPSNLKIQLDTCWSTVGGMDTVALIDKYAGRIPLVHVKDCREIVGEEQITFTELGQGIMDLAPVLSAAKRAGVQWFIVEQDESEGDSLESAAINAAFMHRQNQAV